MNDLTTGAATVQPVALTFGVKAFRKALDLAIKFLPRRCHRPILTMVRLTVGPDGAFLEATDLDKSVKVRVGGTYSQSDYGSVMLDPSQVKGFLKSVGVEQAHVRQSLDKVILNTEHTRLEIPVDPKNSPELFPTAPGWDDTATHCRISAADMVANYDRTAYATDASSTRYALGSILMEIAGDGTGVVVATDGRRLARRTFDLERRPGKAGVDLATNILIPEPTFKLAREAAKWQGETVELQSAKDGAMVFRIGDVEIYSRTMEGRFPRYQDVFPNVHDIAITLDCDELADVVAGAVSTNVEATQKPSTDGQYALDLLITDSGVVVETERNQSVAYSRRIEADTAGPARYAQLDSRYVLDIVKSLGKRSGELTVKVVDDRNPVVITAEDGRLSCIIMPLNGRDKGESKQCPLSKRGLAMMSRLDGTQVNPVVVEPEPQPEPQPEVYSPEPGDIPAGIDRIRCHRKGDVSVGADYVWSDSESCWRQSLPDGYRMETRDANRMFREGTVSVIPEPEPTVEPTIVRSAACTTDPDPETVKPLTVVKVTDFAIGDRVVLARSIYPERIGMIGTVIKVIKSRKAVRFLKDGTDPKHSTSTYDASPENLDKLPTDPDPVPPISGGSPALDVIADPFATVLDIPVTEDEAEPAEMTYREALYSAIYAPTRRSRLARVEEALRTIVATLLARSEEDRLARRPVDLADSARWTWDAMTDRREDFLEWVESQGIRVDPFGDAPTKPAEMFVWFLVECQIGCPIEFPAPTSPEGDDHGDQARFPEHQGSQIQGSQRTPLCDQGMVSRSTPLPRPNAGRDDLGQGHGIATLATPEALRGDRETSFAYTGVLTDDAVESDDADSRGIPAGLHAGRVPAGHGSPVAGLDNLGSDHLRDTRLPGGCRALRGVEAPPAAAGVVEAPATLMIKGRPYHVESVADGFDLVKPDGSAYRVTAEPVTCECRDWRFRRAGVDSLGCIHIRAAREAGLIPAGGLPDFSGSTLPTEETVMPSLESLGIMPVCGGSPEAELAGWVDHQAVYPATELSEYRVADRIRVSAARYPQGGISSIDDLLDGFECLQFPGDRPEEAAAWLAARGFDPERAARMVAMALECRAEALAMMQDREIDPDGLVKFTERETTKVRRKVFAEMVS